MKTFKKVLSIIMVIAVIAGIAVAGTISPAAKSTGVGLSEWAMRAYYEGWSYVWGGAEVGAVDCGGLIYAYCGGNRTSMLADAQANGMDWGYVSSGVPNIHGLGLSRPNHVGVYVGNGMEVDARGSDYGVCYQAVGDRWECWFKLTAVSYPTTGWQQFDGDYYYYENGEYLANTSRTIDGVTYYFGSSGASTTTPGDMSATASSSSSSKKSNTTATVKSDNGPLKNGSQGEKVEKLQARLQELGYYDGAIDGDFGAMTEQAFKLFQKTAGLYEDGIAGSDADLLYADDAPYYVAETKSTSKKADLAATGTGDGDEDTAEDEYTEEAEDTDDSAAEDEDAYYGVYVSVGDSGDTVETIQKRLIELKYLEGEADGAFGAMTESAVSAFQAANGLEKTGVVDQNTYDAILSDSAYANPIQKSTETVAPTEAKAAANVTATTAPSTEIEIANTAISSKAVSGVTDTLTARKTSTTTNFEFIFWLGIMIAVMLIAFVVVYIIEKKKAKAKGDAGRRFQ
jgi:peptidoglycan hydrolase-like protein with peptidoglycan-binding domain